MQPDWLSQFDVSFYLKPKSQCPYRLSLTVNLSSPSRWLSMMSCNGNCSGTENVCSSTFGWDGRRYVEILIESVIYPKTCLKSGGTRCGEITLRRQQITPSMLQSLHTDAVQVLMELTKDETIDDDTTVEHRETFATTFTTQPNRLVCLKATLKNPTGMCRTSITPF